MCSKTLLRNATCLSLLLALHTSNAWCQEKTWALAGDGNWAVPENWLPTGAPNSVGVSAQINNGGTASVTTTASVGSLHLGRSSTEAGHLVILPSGQFTNTILYAGDAGMGSARLEGGAWTANSIRVGNIGTGNFTVSLGGRLTSGSSYLGFEQNAFGEAVVDGASSKWTFTAGSTMNVGWNGEGKLFVRNGGTIDRAKGSLGTFSTGVGEATIDGGTWLYDLEMNVGVFGGRGTLNIQNGGKVTPSGTSTSYSYLGWGQNSHGEATVKDMGSLWTVNGPFYVGYRATGKLTISDEGLVQNTQVELGNFGGSSGEAMVTRDGTWKSSSYMGVGNHGNGKLHITAGGLVENTGGYVGYQSTSVSSVLVDGENSLWNNSDELVVGYWGVGTLDISNQATVANTYGYIGDTSSGRGTVNVSTDAVWDNNDDLYVGWSGRGTLNILDGGTVQNNVGVIGRMGNSRNNVVNVGGQSDTGPSVWQNRETLRVGEFGAGTLNVTSGGRVESVIASFGNSGGGSGVVNVDGGSLVTDSYFYVGNFGTGELSVTNGGTVTANGTGAIIGANASGNGTVMVNGDGSVLDVAGHLEVAELGKGQLQIMNDALVLSDLGTIGYEPGSVGSVTVDHAMWEMTGNLSVGAYGEGTLEILSGGVVQNQIGTVNSSIPRPGDPPYPLSTVTVTGFNASGSSRWLSRGDLLIGGNGAAELRLLDGGIASSETQAYIWPHGTVFGVGTLSAPLVRNDGVIAPGTSPGTLTIDGNYTQGSSGKLQIELASPASYDVLAVTGKANLGGILEIILIDGFSPATTDTFEFLTAASFAGEFADVIVSSTAGGSGTFDFAFTPAGLALSNFQPATNLPGDFNDDGTVDAADYVVWRKGVGIPSDSTHYNLWSQNFGASSAGSGSANAQVPEPSSLWLAVMAGASIFRRQWMRGGGIMRRLKRGILLGCLSVFSVVVPGSARGDIFQWEYINPANPSQGKQQSTVLCPGGAGVNAVPGAALYSRDLTMAYLIGADLTEALLFSSTLTNADLSQSNLTAASFNQATLGGAVFTGAQVRRASFNGVTSTGFVAAQLYSTASYQSGNLRAIALRDNNLTGWNFVGQDLTDASFTDATLTSADFSNANLTKASLRGATLTGASFSGAQVRGTNFDGTTSKGFTAAQLYSTASYQAGDLTSIDLRNNNLNGWSLAGKNFTSAFFNSSTLVGTNLSQANLTSANFSSATLENANLSQANLTSTNFNSTTLTGANFTGANVRGAILQAATTRGFTAAQLYSTASYQSGDLTGIFLGSNNLTGWNFAGKNLTNARFDAATLTAADFTGADVRGASFSTTTSIGFTATQLYSTASYQAGDLTGMNFGNDNLTGWNFAGKNLSNTSFLFATLTGASLNQANLTNANFSSANLTNANLSQTNLSTTNFVSATLTGANFTGADVRGARLSNVTSSGFTAAQLYSTASYQAGDLTGIFLFSNNLSGWNFAGKNLTGASFSSTTLTGTDFTGAEVRSAIFESLTGFTAAQLYSTASYQAGDLTGLRLANNNLTGWNFANKNLANVSFFNATLTSADFTGADVRGASFQSTTSKGFTTAQLYSTASYQTGDLTGIFLTSNNLTGWNFAGKNLTNAHFGDATLTSANFTGANVRGASFSNTTSKGFTAAQLYSTASYQSGDLTGIRLPDNNLSGWDFTGKNLSNGEFTRTTLTGTVFTGADIRGANFDSTTSRGFTAAQLYSTASYQAGDLTGIRLHSNDLTGWNLSGQNLSQGGFASTTFNRTDLSHAKLVGANFTSATFRGANLSHANLTNANLNGATWTDVDLTGADTRGSQQFNLLNTMNTNTIFPDGTVRGLNLTGNRMLTVRDYDGNPQPFFGVAPFGPIPILVQQQMTMDSTGVLRMEFEADGWDSLMSFAPGIAVTRGGTLQLDFAAGVDVAAQSGRTIRLFDWSGVTPTGQFTIASPHSWDTSRLYTTGEITLGGGGLTGDYNDDGTVDAADYVVWRKNPGGQYNSTHYDAWRQNFGASSAGSGSGLAQVPEPASLWGSLALVCCAIIRRRRSMRRRP